jgi:hypothetical protein
VLAVAAPVQAQLFSRKAPPNPSQRVPELVLILKTDPDERKRLHAAEELREYDAGTYTEIVPVLADVLLHEKKANVRLEALNSLFRIRPVQPVALTAIEKAANEDEFWRIRWQAKVDLTKLQLSGYPLKKAEAPVAIAKKKSSEEPALLEPTGPPARFVVEALPPPANPAPRPAANAPPAPRPLPSSVAPNPPLQGPSLFP